MLNELLKKTVIDIFLERAGEYPDHTAVMDVRGAYTYAQLNRGSGYRDFMKNMSDIYLGQALVSWRHDYRTLVRKAGGTTGISMDLTKEEAWNVARARMIVMEEAEPGMYQFIYYNTNLQQLDSHLSADYAGEALYLLDESGQAKQGPISYLPVENGFALYGILHFEIDWEKPFDQQKLMTEARLIFRPAENGTYVLSEIMTSDVSPDGLFMPSAIRLDSCEDLEIINFGPVDDPDGIRSLNFQIFYPGIDIPHPDTGITFAFLPVESEHERFAYIRLTDLQGELICSNVVSLSGSEEQMTD